MENSGLRITEKTIHIHPAAIVSDNVQVGRGTTIGPYAVIEEGVVIGENCVIAAHVVIRKGSVLENNITVDSFTVIGGAPQMTGFDLSTQSGVKIGSNTVIREGVTIHRSALPGGQTIIGKNVMLMASSHVGHDAVVGNNVILANAVLLGGHSRIDAYVFIGGGAGVHQFLRIGEGAMIAGGARITLDIPPFSMIAERNELSGLNLIGLKRREIAREEIAELKQCFHAVYDVLGNPYEKAQIARGGGLGKSRCAGVFLDFFNERGKKGIVSSMRMGRGE